MCHIPVVVRGGRSAPEVHSAPALAATECTRDVVAPADHVRLALVEAVP